MHTIAYLGPAGTFSEEAAIRYAADRSDVAHLPLASIPAVVTAIETDAAAVGLLPIENLPEGSVIVEHGVFGVTGPIHGHAASHASG